MTRRGTLRLLAALTLVLTASACRATVAVDLEVEEDGSGAVEVELSLDEDAVARTGDPATLLRTADLERAGWEVSEPLTGEDGWTRVAARKPFGTPEEAGAVLEEVDGDTGALRDLSVRVEDGFAVTTYRFDGTADLTGGLEQFSDPALAEALDGEPLGQPVEALEERFGVELEEAFELLVSVRLPGELESPAAVSGDRARWSASLADRRPTELQATGEVSDRAPLLWLGAAGIAALGALAVLASVVVRGVRARSRRGEGAGDGGPAEVG